jgi:hypothetical protein
MNSGSIWQPPINDDALTSPFTATRSRAWIIDSASMIVAPRSPNESIQSPISPPPAELHGGAKAPPNDRFHSRPFAGITLGESLGRFWACDDRFGGVMWPLRGDGNRPDNRKLQQVNRRLRWWQTSLHLARRRTAEALGIEFASQNKLNDLGCETIVLPCVRGLQNSSSPIKGASRSKALYIAPKERWVRVEKFRGPNEVYLGAQRPVSWHALACAAQTLLPQGERA